MSGPALLWKPVPGVMQQETVPGLRTISPCPEPLRLLLDRHIDRQEALGDIDRA